MHAVDTAHLSTDGCPVINRTGPLDRAATATRREPGKILVTRVGLQIPEDLSYEDWENAGVKLARIADTSAWCLGDWLVHGQERFRERYQSAIKSVGLDYQTLRNYAWVARKFPASRRRYQLSVQHHAEVASLDADEQDRWLGQAEAKGWSRNELRIRIRAAAGQLPAVTGVVTVPRFSVTQQYLQRWRAAAELSCTSLEGWLVATLNDAATEALGTEDAGVNGAPAPAETPAPLLDQISDS
ncbi:MAG TPA: LmbU family transcriptional regulator [Jatrophihabitans sp.]|nr:LmbU family transcriptional regulator [Jatrophihabitans sp.]